MPTFFDRFSELCKENGETPNSLGRKLGIPSGSITAWKKGTIPRMKTLDLLARHFHVSVDYLIGNVNEPFFYLDNDRIIREINSYEDDEKAPALTEKDQRDVAREVDRIMDDLADSGDLMFDGVPMSDEARAAMAAAMRIGLEEARRRNKETYTPKKYKKG